jgi:hypothetical protein
MHCFRWRLWGVMSSEQGFLQGSFYLARRTGRAKNGTLIAVTAAFGIPPDVALAMALIKRIPDLVLGLPSLLAWQALEGRRLMFRRK